MPQEHEDLSFLTRKILSGVVHAFNPSTREAELGVSLNNCIIIGELLVPEKDPVSEHKIDS